MVAAGCASHTAQSHDCIDDSAVGLHLLVQQYRQNDHMIVLTLPNATPSLMCSAVCLQCIPALAAALAQRNKELKEAQEQVLQLQQQQANQREAANRQLEVAMAQHAAVVSRLDQEKEQYMKDALKLEVCHPDSNACSSLFGVFGAGPLWADAGRECIADTHI